MRDATVTHVSCDSALESIPPRPERDPSTTVEPTADDRYVFLRLHRSGGLGDIWLVRDRVFGLDVALKKLSPERAGDPHARWLIREEARIHLRLQHPNILPIYDVGHDAGGAFYYTMRFVHGRTLAHRIRTLHRRMRTRWGRLGRRRLLECFRATCNAVAYAHSQGVLHLDLKPRNVLVGDYGEVFLLDWGCARTFEEARTDPGGTRRPGQPERRSGRRDDGTERQRLVGTPAYMAPEQVRRVPLSAATDVYGLGAILFEILTGEPPRECASLKDLKRMLGERDGPDRAERIRELQPKASRALSAICARCMADDPDDRYRTVGELRRDVERYLADAPVSVYRASLRTRVARWARHHPVAATLSLATVGFALAFYSFLLRGVVQQRAQALTRSIHAQMESATGAVSALRILFEVDGAVSREEFRSFAQPYLASTEELRALEWVPLVTRERRHEYEGAVRDSGWPRFEVASTFGFVQNPTGAAFEPATARERYFPVYFLEPFEGNESAFGLDLGSCPQRFEAISAALATGRTAVTGPLRLVQDEPGLLVFQPVRKRTGHAGEPTGLTVGVVSVGRLFESALAGLEMRSLRAQVWDVTDPEDPRLLWSRGAAEREIRPGVFGAEETFAMLDRRWRVAVRPEAGFGFTYPFTLATSSEP